MPDMTDPLVRWREKEIGAMSHMLGCQHQGEPCLECECGLPNRPAWANPTHVHRIEENEEAS